MDLMQLEMLVAAVEAGGVQKAAERVFRTQPAVSMALRKLEQEVGAPIFDRSNRGAYVLTATGELLYLSAKRLLRIRDETLTELRQLHDLRSGKIRIGANESVGNYLLPGILQVFHDKFPQIKVEVERRQSHKLIQDVMDNVVDVAFVSFLSEDNKIETIPVMHDELVLIAGRRHELAKKKSVQIRDLGNATFIAHNVISPSRDKVVEMFRRADTPLNISMEIASLEIIKKLVSKNLGLAFIPLISVQDELDRGDVARIRVEGFNHSRTVWLVRRRSDAHSHACEEFTKTVASLARPMRKSAT